MNCPHCLTSFHPEEKHYDCGNDSVGRWSITQYTCPSCKKFIFFLHEANRNGLQRSKTLVHPRSISRKPLSSDIPSAYAGDYVEACLVISDSAKASAALSRRCLQNILRDVANIKKSNLSQEIDDVLNSGNYQHI